MSRLNGLDRETRILLHTYSDFFRFWPNAAIMLTGWPSPRTLPGVLVAGMHEAHKLMRRFTVTSKPRRSEKQIDDWVSANVVTTVTAIDTDTDWFRKGQGGLLGYSLAARAKAEPYRKVDFIVSSPEPPGSSAAPYAEPTVSKNMARTIHPRRNSSSYGSSSNPMKPNFRHERLAGQVDVHRFYHGMSSVSL